MAVDREKILQAAQKYVDKKKYARAISEYQKLIVGNPNDARTLLKIGDLQARTSAYADAVATYDRVGHYYSSQGFALKAVAVYKQIRELLEKYVPELTERYSHIVPKLAEIYAELGLLSEALGAYEEVVARALNNGKERDALDVLRKMAGIDANNPLRHVRLAEACCRLQELDEAIESFGIAAELLIAAGHRDDGLKVLERMLHFRPEPRFARLAAEHYLDRGSSQDGLLALGKLQVCFQADPHDLATLELLARVFTTIDQEQKAFEVRKEMARIAFEQGHHEVYRDLIETLRHVAPDDPQVESLAKLHERMSTAADSNVTDLDELDAADVSLDEADVNEISVTSIIEGLDHDFAGRVELEDHGTEPLNTAAMIEDHSQVIEEIGYADETDAQTHADRATRDAEKFRELKLYSKAIETLRIAIELNPSSIELHEHLIEILAEAGDRGGTIQEMVALATLQVDNGETALAADILRRVLEAEPEHPEATELLSELHSGVDHPVPSARSWAEAHEPELPAYDSEEGTGSHSSSVDTAVVAGATGKPARGAPTRGHHEGSEQALKSGLVASPPPAADSSIEALEAALEEAEFYASCGLNDDAKTILLDLWVRFPDHPLLLERMNELGVAPAAKGKPARLQPSAARPATVKNEELALDEVIALDDADDEPLAAKASGGRIHAGRAFTKEATPESSADADGATHYELGVAYKEMGLSEEALTEFELATRDAAHECASYIQIGAIQRELHDTARATDAYLKALNAANKTVEQELLLHYELGAVYELANNREEALYFFKKAARRDSAYRDVQKKIQSLVPGPGKAKPVAKALNEDDEFDKAFDDMFKD